MKILTDGLDSIDLDWAVARCEGHRLANFIKGGGLVRILPDEGGSASWRPSASWTDCGPIIEREKIDVAWSEDGWYANMYWRGLDVIPAGAAGESFRCGGDGPTPLIAAMRCYVKSKLGDRVEVPDSLLG